ncbi:MAG: TonB-dependent receptor, partial [Bacteroidetes bacterium]|nr:TonB-dependent receptor [Bacteroidota bacterium]
MTKKLLFLISFIALSQWAVAQGSVRGFIKDKETGQPVFPITIGLEGTEYGGATDNSGYYSLTKVPAGNYNLVIISMEFKAIKEAITIVNGQVLTKNYLVEKDGMEMSTLEINSRKADQINNVNISSETIRSQDIKKIPSIGGQTDIVQYLTVLPGFVSTGDQGGQIFVRGGSPVQNKVMLDGMIIYNPFHSIGLFSVFDTDIISTADVYTGGFNAQYGGRLSSVMDITTRDGNKRKNSGRVGVNPFGAKVLLE